MVLKILLYHKSGRFTTRLKKFALIVDLGQLKLTNFTVAIIVHTSNLLGAIFLVVSRYL